MGLRVAALSRRLGPRRVARPTGPARRTMCSRNMGPTRPRRGAVRGPMLRPLCAVSLLCATAALANGAYLDDEDRSIVPVRFQLHQAHATRWAGRTLA